MRLWYSQKASVSLACPAPNWLWSVLDHCLVGTQTCHCFLGRWSRSSPSSFIIPSTSFNPSAPLTVTLILIMKLKSPFYSVYVAFLDLKDWSLTFQYCLLLWLNYWIFVPYRHKTIFKEGTAACLCGQRRISVELHGLDFRGLSDRSIVKPAWMRSVLKHCQFGSGSFWKDVKHAEQWFLRATTFRLSIMLDYLG